jgi:hypothetical protein
MKKYYARLVTSDYAFFPDPPYRGRGWQITFEKYPQFKFASSTTNINGIDYPGKAIIIHAGSLERAQYVSDLIHASFLISRGERAIFLPFRSNVIPLDPNDSKKLSVEEEDINGPLFASTMDLPLGCLIARQASYRRAYQNAIFKYVLSFETFPTSQFDLDPSNWRPTKSVFDFPDHHTRCAYAIVIGYSVLEEISLEIRASASRPSFIRGKWNPVVRNDLEGRLEDAGIRISDPIPWVIRDTPTRIEKLKPPKMFTRAEWSFGKVRDIEMKLVDAIAYASWLRSRISAHRFSELVGALNYYDVANVQHLARRLLLEKMGFWLTDLGYHSNRSNGA